MVAGGRLVALTACPHAPRSGPSRRVPAGQAAGQAAGPAAAAHRRREVPRNGNDVLLFLLLPPLLRGKLACSYILLLLLPLLLLYTPTSTPTPPPLDGIVPTLAGPRLLPR